MFRIAFETQLTAISRSKSPSLIQHHHPLILNITRRLTYNFPSAMIGKQEPKTNSACAQALTVDYICIPPSTVMMVCH
jgi:hypothetical protein